MRGIIPYVDTQASQDGREEKITARYNAANKKAAAAAVRDHYAALREAVRQIVSGTAHPYMLSDVASKAIERGLPVDSHALFAPEHVLATEARFIALAIPSLKNLHEDCLAWLEVKLKRPRERFVGGSIPWNLVVGGQAIK